MEESGGAFKAEGTVSEGKPDKDGAESSSNEP